MAEGGIGVENDEGKLQKPKGPSDMQTDILINTDCLQDKAAKSIKATKTCTPFSFHESAQNLGS